MKEEERRGYKVSVSLFVIVGMIMAGAIPLGVFGAGSLPYYDIEQDSLGNYHKAYIDNSTGNYEVYYTNDIGGNYSQDWNPPIRITNTTTDSLLLDLGIYLPTDLMFIIWEEVIITNATTSTNLTYYTLSGNYGVNWTEPQRSYENIILKFAEFDPLVEEPIVPSLPVGFADPYAYYIVQFKTPMIDDWWGGIEAAGGIFCGHIPNNAHIVWMNPTVKDQVELLPYIRWIGYYHPIYKIDSNLLHRNGIIELNVMVIKETGGQINLDKVISEIEALGGIIIYDGSDNYIIRTQIDASKIYDIALIHEVEWIDRWAPPVACMNNVRIITGADTLHVNNPPFQGQGIRGEVKDDGFQGPPNAAMHLEFQTTHFATDGNPPDEAHGTCTFGTIFSSGVDGNAGGMLPQGQGIFCDWDIGRRGHKEMPLIHLYAFYIILSSIQNHHAFIGNPSCSSIEGSTC